MYKVLISEYDTVYRSYVKRLYEYRLSYDRFPDWTDLKVFDRNGDMVLYEVNVNGSPIRW